LSNTIPDKIIAEMKGVIGDMEVDSLKLSDSVQLIGDKKLSHSVKIMVGSIQAIRMYVLGNQDVLKNLLVKGGGVLGKSQSEKAKRHQRQSAGHAKRSKRL